MLFSCCLYSPGLVNSPSWPENDRSLHFFQKKIKKRIYPSNTFHPYLSEKWQMTALLGSKCLYLWCCLSLTSGNEYLYWCVPLLIAAIPAGKVIGVYAFGTAGIGNRTSDGEYIRYIESAIKSLGGVAITSADFGDSYAFLVRKGRETTNVRNLSSTDDKWIGYSMPQNDKSRDQNKNKYNHFFILKRDKCILHPMCRSLLSPSCFHMGNVCLYVASERWTYNYYCRWHHISNRVSSAKRSSGVWPVHPPDRLEQRTRLPGKKFIAREKKKQGKVEI